MITYRYVWLTLRMMHTGEKRVQAQAQTGESELFRHERVQLSAC